ncbi:hypothetical protein C8R47DRAFT_1070329 [Mycena vitilis]|nr:hypothetical protein C8R47DRAFT_1070329 [Mycena vitilis]
MDAKDAKDAGRAMQLEDNLEAEERRGQVSHGIMGMSGAGGERRQARRSGDGAGRGRWDGGAGVWRVRKEPHEREWVEMMWECKSERRHGMRGRDGGEHGVYGEGRGGMGDKAYGPTASRERKSANIGKYRDERAHAPRAVEKRTSARLRGVPGSPPTVTAAKMPLTAPSSNVDPTSACQLSPERSTLTAGGNDDLDPSPGLLEEKECEVQTKNVGRRNSHGRAAAGKELEFWKGSEEPTEATEEKKEKPEQSH